MNRPLRDSFDAAPVNSIPVSKDGFTRPDGRPPRNRPLMRKYEVAYLGPNSDGLDFTRIAPALPDFESAFAGFARGTLIGTPDGLCAVEDLQPGMKVSTQDMGPQTLLWKGAITLLPDVPGQAPEMGKLVRVSADTFGPSRPMPDLMLGAAARLFDQSPLTRSHIGALGSFVPVRNRIDGDMVIEITPVAPVRIFHLGFLSHHRINANGLDVESYHPGSREDFALSGELEKLFLSLFPHVNSLRDFGAMLAPRVPLDSWEAVA